jgi:hypothetical protein
MVAQTLSTARPSFPEIQITDARALCRRINAALDQAGFDDRLEGICRPYVNGAEGRSPISLGLFFRLIVCSYLNERGDLRSLAGESESPNTPIEILGVSSLLPAGEGRNPVSAVYRLPLDVHRQAFTHALAIIGKAGLLDHGSAETGPSRLNRRTLPPGPIHNETGDDWGADTTSLD